MKRVIQTKSVEAMMGIERLTFNSKTAQMLAELDIECFTSEAWSAKDWESTFRLDTEIYGKVNKAGNGLICAASWRYCADPNIATGYLLSNAVMPKFRGLGLGEELLKIRLKRAKELKIKILFANTRLSNSTSAYLLKKYGFKVAGYQTDYYLDEDGLLWRKG